MTKRKLILAALAGASMLAGAAPAQAQDYFLGQIMIYGNSFCPRGMTEANGAILPIRQYTALFSLYGTQFGGNGTTTFQLPDLQGRTGINQGQGPGLADYVIGEEGGAETTLMTVNEMPMHTHSATMAAYNGTPNTDNPTGASFADFPNNIAIYNNATAPDVNMAVGTLLTLPAGGGEVLPTRAPYLTLRYCVVMDGIFPQRP